MLYNPEIIYVLRVMWGDWFFGIRCLTHLYCKLYEHQWAVKMA